MIIGAHSILHSTNADADRAFFRDVLKLGNIDMGDGWLIFGLPPAEVAIHPSEQGGKHELYLMCENIETFVAATESAGLSVTPVSTQDWGLLVRVTLPGGGQLGVYQPMHPRPGTPGSSGGGGAASIRPGAKSTVKKAKTKAKAPAKTKKSVKKTPKRSKAAAVKAEKPKKATKKAKSAKPAAKLKPAKRSAKRR